MVLTSGVFDVLHVGHVMLFKQIKDSICITGEELCVGVNCDRRALELKDLLCFPLLDRMFMLESTVYVDKAYPFNGDDPSDLIRRLRPRVFVKGGDYTIKDLPEREACNEVGAKIVILPLSEIDGRKVSSSAIRLGETYIDR